MTRDFTYTAGDRTATVAVEKQGDAYVVTLGAHTYRVHARTDALSRLDLNVDGRQTRAYVAADGDARYVGLDGATWTLVKVDPRRRAQRGRGGAGDSTLVAVMPSLVLDVLVSQGDAVEKGDVLVLLEAMKMEIRLTAPRAGRVEAVNCRAGEVVQRGQMLVTLAQPTDAVNGQE